MKKQLLNLMTIVFFAISAASIAQPILTATGINPQVGEDFTLHYSPYVNPGNAGVSQTWDLSSMSGTSAGLTNLLAPSSTTNGSSFTNSNVTWHNPTEGSDLYWKTSSTTLQSYGVVSGTTVIPYSNPEDYMHFPFAFNNTFSDAWAAQFVSYGYTYYRTGTSTVTADGWGTVTTPNGTFNNVMRVHLVQIYQDSTYFASPYIITYNNDEYLWYKDGVHVPLATVYTLTSSAGGPYTKGTYLGSLVGVNDIPDFINKYTFSPNPASDIVNLAYSLTENKKTEVKIFNSLGQLVLNKINEYTVQGLNTMELSVGTLPDGIYFAEILLEGNVANTKRFIVSK